MVPVASHAIPVRVIERIDSGQAWSGQAWRKFIRHVAAGMRVPLIRFSSANSFPWLWAQLLGLRLEELVSSFEWHKEIFSESSHVLYVIFALLNSIPQLPGDSPGKQGLPAKPVRLNTNVAPNAPEHGRSCRRSR
jgi:hypothetical protein